MHTPRQLADELLDSLHSGRVTTWSPMSLGIDASAFDRIANRILELDLAGQLRVIAISRDSSSGQFRMSSISFMKRSAQE